jgi:hypothetical protein
MKKNLLLLSFLPFVFSCAMWDSMFSSDSSPENDAEIMAHEFDGWDVSGNPTVDKAANALDVICIAVQGEFQKAYSLIEDSGFYNQVLNEIDSRLSEYSNANEADESTVTQAVLSELTAAQRSSVSRMKKSLGGYSKKIADEIVKTVVQMTIVNEFIGDISLTDTSNMAIVAQLKGLISDVDVAKTMQERTNFMKAKLDVWDQEISRMNG